MFLTIWAFHCRCPLRKRTNSSCIFYFILLVSHVYWSWSYHHFHIQWTSTIINANMARLTAFSNIQYCFNITGEILQYLQEPSEFFQNLYLMPISSPEHRLKFCTVVTELIHPRTPTSTALVFQMQNSHA